jgi:hypothetical protein
MHSNPEVPAQPLPLLKTHSLMLAAVTLLAACSFSGPQPRPGPAEIVPRISNAVPAVVASPPPPVELTPAPAPTVPDAQAQTGPLARVLGYVERLRGMPAAELASEAARLAAPGEASVPASQVQLALVLGQTRQLPDLVRAHELVGRVLANTSAEAQPLYPLARVLALRFGEQRRVEDQLDKERQQSRELQKKLDQTNERLEALKAIERSLTARPPPPPVTTVNPVAPVSPIAPGSSPATRRSSAPP